jgi:hypothetical protein
VVKCHFTLIIFLVPALILLALLVWGGGSCRPSTQLSLRLIHDTQPPHSLINLAKGLVCFLYITVNRCQEISPVLLLTARNWRYFGIPTGDRDRLQPTPPRSSTLYIIAQTFCKGELAFVEQEGRDVSCFNVARNVLIPLLQN